MISLTATALGYSATKTSTVMGDLRNGMKSQLSTFGKVNVIHLVYINIVLFSFVKEHILNKVHFSHLGDSSTG